METGLGLVLEDVPYQLGNICGVWGHCVPGGHIAHTLGKPLWGTVRRKACDFIEINRRYDIKMK